MCFAIGQNSSILAYANLNETGTVILKLRLRNASGGAGKGDALRTISNACLSKESKPLPSFTLADNTLPLPSSLRSSNTSPCWPRICAIFGYDLCLAIARPANYHIRLMHHQYPVDSLLPV